MQGEQPWYIEAVELAEMPRCVRNWLSARVFTNSLRDYVRAFARAARTPKDAPDPDLGRFLHSRISPACSTRLGGLIAHVNSPLV